MSLHPLPFAHPLAGAGSHWQAPVGHRHDYCTRSQQDHHCYRVWDAPGCMSTRHKFDGALLLAPILFHLPFVHLSYSSNLNPSSLLALSPFSPPFLFSDSCIQFFELSNFEPYCQLAYLENLAMKLDFWCAWNLSVFVVPARCGRVGG